MGEREKIVLPPKYYLDYFQFLIDFVAEKSNHLLGKPGSNFISAFSNLSENAQCVAIRMANRKGEYFRVSKMKYEEIDNMGLAVDELVVSNFASFEPPLDPVLFNLFTKSELHHLFPDREYNKKNKSEILLELAEENELDDFQKINAHDTILHFTKQEEIEFLKLLFFGHNHGMMTEFVIRDIGNVKLENLEGHQFTPWFDSHEEALAVFELSKLNRLIKEFMAIGLPEDLLAAISHIKWADLINYRNAAKSRDRIMLHLGEYFEKANYLEEALSYYSQAKKHPCRERQIRIYEKLSRDDEALDLAQLILESPFNASEKMFAKDFIAKKEKKNYRSTSARIKLSHEISVDGESNQRVEDKALDHFRALEYEGIHAENYLWRSIFGLIFWEELFDSNQTSFHHPLQRVPSDLYSTAFYINRESELHKKIASIKSKKRLLKQITDIYQDKNGINNPLVGWNDALLPVIEKCIALLPLRGLKQVMLEIAKNVKDNSTGFPDLFIWKEDDYQFYEVKSPNDHLSSQQLFWLDFFQENKIKSEILRVKYL